MRRFMLPVVTFGVVLTMGLACVAAEWLPGRCRPVGPENVRVAQGGYKWERSEDYPEASYLYWGERLVGIYCWDTGFYHPWNGSAWLQKAKSPIPPPFGEAGRPGTGAVFGVDSQKRSETPRIWGDTGELTPEAAGAALGGELVDDSRTPHVTVIARDAETRKKVAADIVGSVDLASARGKARFQVYDPANKPSLSLLAPFQLDRDPQYQASGIAVIAQPAATGGDGKAKPVVTYAYSGPQDLVAALRSVDPTYNPVKPWTPTLPDFPHLEDTDVILLIVCLVILYFVIRTAKQD